MTKGEEIARSVHMEMCGSDECGLEEAALARAIDDALADARRDALREAREIVEAQPTDKGSWAAVVKDQIVEKIRALEGGK